MMGIPALRSPSKKGRLFCNTRFTGTKTSDAFGALFFSRNSMSNRIAKKPCMYEFISKIPHRTPCLRYSRFSGRKSHPITFRSVRPERMAALQIAGLFD